MYRFIFFILLFAGPYTFAQEVWVFTDQHHTVFAVPEQARVFELDQTQQIENALSEGLSADQAYSAKFARSRLNTNTHRQLAQAYQGNVDAWTLGIQKIPAVVVDRKYVIYGESNVTRAISRIQTYREAHP